MTDKHNWVKGEVITSDLLNSMTTYAEEKINALPVIGENLLLNSATMQGTGWMDATQPAANIEDNGDGTLSYVATGDWHSTRYNFSDLLARNVVAIGDVLTYSEDVFIGDGFTQNGVLFVFGDYLGKTIVDGRNLIINVVDMKQGWQRISVTFTVTNPPTSDDYKNSLRFEFGGIGDTAHFKFRKPKLEHGAVATPWCPAYADTLKALTNVYTKPQVDEAITNAKSYTDTTASTTLSNAKSYTDTQLADTIKKAGDIEAQSKAVLDDIQKNPDKYRGVKGDAGTIKIGTVTTADTPSVTNTGTPSDAILNFGLVKGDKGDSGFYNYSVDLTDAKYDRNKWYYVESDSIKTGTLGATSYFSLEAPLFSGINVPYGNHSAYGNMDACSRQIVFYCQGCWGGYDRKLVVIEDQTNFTTDGKRLLTFAVPSDKNLNYAFYARGGLKIGITSDVPGLTWAPHTDTFVVNDTTIPVLNDAPDPKALGLDYNHTFWALPMSQLMEYIKNS